MKKHIFVILKIVGFFTLWILAILLSNQIGDPSFVKGNKAIQRLWREFTPFLSVIVITVFFILVFEKYKCNKIDLKNVLKNSIFGIFTGIGWIGIPFLVLYFTGNLYIGNNNHVPYLYLWIISAFINVAMQEYLVRGYVFKLLKREYNVLAAVIITTIIFTLFHGGAFEAGIIAVLNVLTMSIFMSVVLIYTTNLLATIIIHAIWNVIGFLSGCVALAEDYPVFKNITLTGKEIISGGIYKLEGSIIVLLVNMIGIMVILLLIQRKKNSL